MLGLPSLSTKLVAQSLSSSRMPPFSKNRPYFYVKRTSLLQFSNCESLVMRLNSKTDMSQAQQWKGLSIWSLCHLKALVCDYPTINISNVTLSNPFKPYDLVETSLKHGLEAMVVQDMDEIEKIQNIKFQITRKTLRNHITKYYWKLNHFPSDLQLLTSLKKQYFYMHGLVCPTEISHNPQEVVEFLRKCKKIGHPIKRMTIVTTMNEYQSKRHQFEKYRQNIDFEIKDINHTNFFNIVCQIRAFDQSSQPVVSDQAQELMGAVEGKNFQILEAQGKKWIITKPRFLNLTKDNTFHLTHLN